MKQNSSHTASYEAGNYHQVVFDEQQQQIRVHLEGGDWARMDYYLEGRVMTITSTRIPESMRGKGYGNVMMECILPLLEARQWQLIPRCSYVAHYLQRHSRWQHLLKTAGE